MNPFEDNNISTSQLDLTDNDEFKIEIWVESKGRKCITFISGWNIDDTTLATHLKTIKKKNACNGSFKTISEGTKTFKLIQFQGDHATYMSTFIKDKGVPDECIKMKGTII